MRLKYKNKIYYSLQNLKWENIKNNIIFYIINLILNG